MQNIDEQLIQDIFNPIKWLQSLLAQIKAIPNGDANFTLIITYLLLIIIFAGLSLQGIKHLLSALVDVIESLKKLGFKHITNAELRQEIKRRNQFSKVILSDLNTIAKAENWNDQWFTDLEAEIEIEGGYYQNNLAKMIKRKSFGLRKVPSLLGAIKTSADKCMLLVGEPGSGKSVALRHLASEFAEIASKSKSDKVLIPLYINLKEFPNLNISDLCANTISDFVLSNIRRGDSDTADFIKEHWNEYKQKGTWFFLFDSFDEIPAVMHAKNGSKIISAHSEAIRQFMDGMGDCRGILASREYRGPEALYWQKLRILPLSNDKKDELIENTFLSVEKKGLARKHLAVTEGNIFGNPLFLTLLCRYINDIGLAPNNDHDLVINHIKRLSNRDSEYIQNKYGIRPEQLYLGSTVLATIFAVNTNLSLAPTYDEIEYAFSCSEWKNIFNTTNLLSALIEIKICRSDIREARQGDQRITFSHRRYQESLFVEYLTDNPGFISARELLTLDKWREFAVTILQTKPPEKIKHLTEEAASILETIKLEYETIKYNNTSYRYYKWGNTPFIHIIEILNSGLFNRPDAIDEKLKNSIFNVINSTGNDPFDMLMLVKYCSLMDENYYQDILQFTIYSNIDKYVHASFYNAKFLRNMPDLLMEKLRRKFSDKIILAKNNIELNKIEAFGRLLPEEFGAQIIANRGRKIRILAFKYWISQALRSIISKILNLTNLNSNSIETKLVYLVIATQTYMAIGVVELAKYYLNLNKTLTAAILALLSIYYTYVSVLYVFRHFPKKIQFLTIFNKKTFTFAALIVGSIFSVTYLIKTLGTDFFANILIAISSIGALFFVIYQSAKGLKFVYFKLSLKSEETKSNRKSHNLIGLFRKAKKSDELYFWLVKNESLSTASNKELRACLLLTNVKFGPLKNVFHDTYFKEIINMLLNKLE